LRSRARIVAAALLFGVVSLEGASLSGAHEFWVEPSSFTPAVNEPVDIRLFIGAEGPPEEVIRSPEHMLRFEALARARAAPIAGFVGDAPAGIHRFDRAGAATIVYVSHHSFLELPPERFEPYLEDEGLSDVVAERVRRNESVAPGRESFARYAKSLVIVGQSEGASHAGFDDEVGLPVELVLETDPATWRSEDSITLRAVYDGLPLADQQVKLIHLVEHELRLVARTDADGRVRFRPPQSGPWLAAAVFMRRAPEGGEADWESFWASLTFALP
jgi:uncharacterized GH25 family protein